MQFGVAGDPSVRREGLVFVPFYVQEDAVCSQDKGHATVEHILARNNSRMEGF
jgi:hypothetical protein